MSDWQERVALEAYELREKIDKLTEALCNDRFVDGISEHMHRIMRNQRESMREYLECLHRRLELAACEAKTKKVKCDETVR